MFLSLTLPMVGAINTTIGLHRGVHFDNVTLLAERLRDNAALLAAWKSRGRPTYAVEEGCSGDHTHNLPVCYQVCSNWCWATCVTMTIGYYTGSDQCVGVECQVAQKELGGFRSCCPWSKDCNNRYDDPETRCNNGGTDQQVADAASAMANGPFQVRADCLNK
jgi:hypothetical protein